MSTTCTICRSQPVEVGRYSCTGYHSCADALRRNLRMIELYAAWLPVMAQPGRSGAGSRAPGYTSQPPVRLDVLVALDPRTRQAADRDYDPVTDDPEDAAPRSVLGSLESWARMIREERDETPPRSRATISGEVGYLLGCVDWATYREWVDELAEGIAEIHRDLRVLVGDRPPAPLAPCLQVGCEGAVFWRYDAPGEQQEDRARCASCGRCYEGVNLLRLRVQEAS